MNERQKNIVTLEEQAEKLVDNLSSLHENVGSYKNAKDELQTTNTALVGLIEQTKLLAIESHKIIAEINKIGTSKIFDRLDNIDQRLDLNEKANSVSNGKLETIDEKLKQQEKKAKSFFGIVIGAAAIMIILQIISLVR
jgi:DNA repair exonuclease SbcCD ATPase subunit